MTPSKPRVDSRSRWFSRLIRCSGLCLALTFFPGPGDAGAVVDILGSADPLEAPLSMTPEALAQYFLPQYIWYHGREECAWPATPEEPGVVVYRVREHPRDPAMRSITYVLLYRDDCGGIFGLDPHPGDGEAFTCTVAPDDSCPSGWRLLAVKTTAHAGAPGDVGEEFVNSCGRLPELFVSLNKHGTYLSLEQCHGNIDPAQRCARGFTTDFELINAGDPENPPADDLSAYFPDEYIWSGDGRFCGGRPVADRAECAGSPQGKLTDDGLLAPARQWATLVELGGEWSAESYATSIAFGDVDGDGIDEVGVTRKTGEGWRFVILDDAAEGFKTLYAAGDDWGSQSHAASIAFGDVDGDGIDEVGLARHAVDGPRFLVLDDALAGFTGLFSGGEQWGPAVQCTAIAFGDVDGDGLEEVGLARKARTGARYFILDDAANGFGRLLAGGRRWALSSYATSMAFGDVDGDGIDEVGVTRKPARGDRCFLLEDASQGFAEMLAAGADWKRGRYATSIAFGDVDGDGLEEVGLARRAKNFANNREERYWVLDDALHGFLELNRGGQGEPTLTRARYECAIAFGDMDGNGRTEVGVGRTHNRNARYWVYDDQDFEFHTTLAGSDGGDWAPEALLTAIAFGDVDGDGDHELGIARQSREGMRVQVRDLFLPAAAEPRTVLVGLGDSLTHGTMDATNNSTNTLNAYLQRMADSLGQVTPLHFTQPLFDVTGKRIQPFSVPTNLAVDGSEVFRMEGLAYYRRVGAEASYLSDDFLADRLLPARLKDVYDKVLYPTNLLAGQPVSQLDAATWLLNTGAPLAKLNRALVMLWAGNNDSSAAALGGGGENPQFQPLPFDVIKGELKPALRLLLTFGENSGAVSFEPYTQSAIERNLTTLEDFTVQFNHVLDRLVGETAGSATLSDVFVMTLPYYSAVGYLFDSEDLEFYLRKANADYTLPESFKRMLPADPVSGDRVSLMTFGMMYSLLETGFSVADVNRVLEIDGQQRDGLVLSEAEERFIMARIDGYNAAIAEAVAMQGPYVHLVDIGGHLNDAFLGNIVIQIGDQVLTRKWIRGGGFCFDGVHPSYTGHTLIANFLLQEINAVLGLEAPLYDLAPVLAIDPYVDQDGDGWAPGPAYEPFGTTKLLFMFKDPDDTDPAVQPEIPPDVWDMVSDVLLSQILGIPAVRTEAERLGIAPSPP